MSLSSSRAVPNGAIQGAAAVYAWEGGDNIGFGMRQHAGGKLESHVGCVEGMVEANETRRTLQSSGLACMDVPSQRDHRFI